MQSKATTVEEYLAALPEDRRTALAAVREVILENLDEQYVEGMHYGMISYFIPTEASTTGSSNRPNPPRPLVSLASQKNHMAVYLIDIAGQPEHEEWFREAWAKTGKKLDMGKSCVRFKKVDDIALDVIGEAVHRSHT